MIESIKMNYYRYLFFCLIILLLIYDIRLMIKNRSLNSQNVELLDENYDLKRDKENLIFNYASQVKIPLKKDIYFLKLPFKNDSTSISSLFARPKIVLYLNEENCKQCLNPIFSYIKINFEKEDIIVFVTYRNSNWVNDLISNYLNGFNTFYVEEDLAFFFNQMNPVFFHIDNNLIANCFFVPSSDDLSSTIQFLTIMKDRFLKNMYD